MLQAHGTAASLRRVGLKLRFEQCYAEHLGVHARPRSSIPVLDCPIGHAPSECEQRIHESYRRHAARGYLSSYQVDLQHSREFKGNLPDDVQDRGPVWLHQDQVDPKALQLLRVVGGVATRFTWIEVSSLSRRWLETIRPNRRRGREVTASSVKNSSRTYPRNVTAPWEGRRPRIPLGTQQGDRLMNEKTLRCSSSQSPPVVKSPLWCWQSRHGYPRYSRRRAPVNSRAQLAWGRRRRRARGSAALGVAGGGRFDLPPTFLYLAVLECV